MYVDDNGITYQDNQPVKSPDGVSYPGNFPKDEIDFLTKVELTEQPEHNPLYVTDFGVIDAVQVWEQTPVSAEEKQSILLNHLADYRYKAEVGGIEINGSEIATDRATQSKINSIYIKAKEDPDYTTAWKAKNGFINLDANTIIAIADAVLIHVQHVFMAEATVMQLDIDTFNSLNDIETAFNDALNALKA